MWSKFYSSTRHPFHGCNPGKLEQQQSHDSVARLTFHSLGSSARKNRKINFNKMPGLLPARASHVCASRQEWIFHAHIYCRAKLFLAVYIINFSADSWTFARFRCLCVLQKIFRHPVELLFIASPETSVSKASKCWHESQKQGESLATGWKMTAAVFALIGSKISGKLNDREDFFWPET